MQHDKVEDAKNACESRANEFKNEIITELYNSCYVIVECISDGSPANEIGLAQIDEMTQEVVQACLNNIVNSVEVNLYDLESSDVDGEFNIVGTSSGNYSFTLSTIGNPNDNTDTEYTDIHRFT